MDDVRAATLDIADAQAVIAREYGFDEWDDLAKFTHAVASDSRVARFESGRGSVVSGDIEALRSMLAW